MADDEDAPRNPRAGGAPAEGDNGIVMGPIFNMWENSLEKLKLLNYEKDYCKRYNRKPFSQVHFAIPGANASHQLDDFSTICSWLCTEITAKADTFKPDGKDDPNTVINKLLLALRQLDFRSSFPPQKLKIPHGEPVCTVLDFLTDKAIATRGFQWAQPVHISVDDVEQAQGNDDEEEDVIEDAAQNEPEEEMFFEDASRLDTSIDLENHNILQAQIDPLEWKTELERVGPKLKANHILTTNEWRSHVDQTITSKANIEKLMSDSQGDLQSMNKHISDELSQMKMKEKYINNQYHSLCLEFVEIKHKLENLEEKSTSSNEIVTKFTNDLAEISDKLEELKESFESKDNGLNDTSPLVKIKGALQSLKDEIHNFDMQIGVISNTLMSARIHDHNRLRMKQQQKAKQRQQRGKRNGAGRDVTEDDSLLSD